MTPIPKPEPGVWCPRCEPLLADLLVKGRPAPKDFSEWLIPIHSEDPTRARAARHRFGAAAIGAILSEPDKPSAERTSKVEFFVRFLRAAVRLLRELEITPLMEEVLGAVLAARSAAIDGDAAVVDEFSRAWLGLSDPARWRNAVEMALLGDWVEVLGRGRTSGGEIADLLRHAAHVEHRRLQPLWERKTRGRRTALLSQPIGTGLVVADLLADHRSPELEALKDELTDSRLAAVLRLLADDEAATAYHWADGSDSWAHAAREAGLPDSYGDRVRRKLKRLGGRHTQRALAAEAVIR
ncbi:hypothetical protein [Kitasatospora sp. NPDC096204]|uniref:hypothetical protein n=1 Tax=Kitasatospora sp. NPDC096204 TaxID=3364094 RepID=UPI00380A2B23